MAPDLNAIQTEKWDYSKPGSAGYDIPNITYDDPKNRKMRILSIGAGFSGVMNAYNIQKYCENVEHVICSSIVQVHLRCRLLMLEQMRRTQTWEAHGWRIAILVAHATSPVMLIP